MIDEKIEQLNFEKVLGFFGLQILDDFNSYYGILLFRSTEYVFYQTQQGAFCLNTDTLSNLSPGEFLATHVKNRSISNLEKIIDQVNHLPDHLRCQIPAFSVIKGSQLLANYLGIESIVDYEISEEDDSNLFQFVQCLDNANCAIFSSKTPNEYVLCFYKDKKLINAVTFNLGSKQKFLSRKEIDKKINTVEKGTRIFVSNINYLINSKIYLHDAQVSFFRRFLPWFPDKKFFENETDTEFIVEIDQFVVAFQILLSSLVNHKVLNSGSVHFNPSTNLIAIHVSGFGKKPFMVDQISEPIKFILRKSLNDGSTTNNNPFQDTIFKENYFQGGEDLIHFTNSRDNDLVIFLPQKEELLMPIFQHFAALNKVNYSINLIP